MKTKLLLALTLVFSFSLYSQSQNEKKNILKKTNQSYLLSLSEQLNSKFHFDSTSLKQIAEQKKLLLKFEKDSVFSELIGFNNLNQPIYYSTYNKGAGETSRANKLYTGGGLGLSIEGQGMTAGIWDAGSAMPSHQLFNGRLELKDASPQTHYHAAHVAGTVIGNDFSVEGLARGMAFKANGHSYDWGNDTSEIASAAANGLLISNHSYGYSPYYTQPHQWGKYDLKSQTIDDIMYNAPYYQFVCAAGNSRGNFNFEKNGYDLLTGHATSKNSIVVAAVNEVSNYSSPNSVVMSSFSSWGPTDDGRIKPDISAKGVNTFSALNNHETSYGNLSGTSMASPSVTGTLLLLQQYYNQINKKFMKASTLRGLMINTADEAGATNGPDYQFGWGLINAEKAAKIIKTDGLESLIIEKEINQGQSQTMKINALGSDPIKVTLCWTDPKGNNVTQIIDDKTPNLVNDLDIKITQLSTTYYPWKLDPANPNTGAITGINDVDNVESINVNGASGEYIITINHKGTLFSGKQNYSLIISGIALKNFWVTNETSNRKVCRGTSQLEFDFDFKKKSTFNKVVLFKAVGLPSGVRANFSPADRASNGAVKLYLNNVTNLTPGEYTFEVRAVSGLKNYKLPVKFEIIDSNFNQPSLTNPVNNSINQTAPLTFNWDSVSNATQYVFQLSNSENFSNIINNEVVNTNSLILNSIQNNSTYYWRVKPKNECGEGNFSQIFTFKTVCDKPTNLNTTNITSNTATINWSDISNSSSWEYQYVTKGTPRAETGTQTNAKPVVINGLTPETCYDFYIKSNCGSGSTSLWEGPFEFCTSPDYCAGSRFYDTGGANGNYKDGENYTKTIYPNNPADRVKAVFNSLNMETCCDYLTIYNGPNTNSPVLYTGNYTLPQNIKSTHSTGL